MKSLLLFAMITLIISANPISMVTISPGSWIVAQKKQPGDAVTEQFFFNKIPIETYYSVGKMRGYLQIPIAWSHEWQMDRGQFGLGDITLYGAYPLPYFEPRFGVVAPGIYDTDKSWIGSRNTKLYLGVSANNNPYKTRVVGVSGEVVILPYVSESGALAEVGSWDLLTLTKVTWEIEDRKNLALEILTNISAVTWKGADNPNYSLTVVPVLFYNQPFGDNITLGAKGGIGPTYKWNSDTDITFTETNYSLSLVITIYPN